MRVHFSMIGVQRSTSYVYVSWYEMLSFAVSVGAGGAVQKPSRLRLDHFACWHLRSLGEPRRTVSYRGR